MGPRVLLATGLALVALLPARRSEANCDDPFGDPNRVLDFHVRMKRADWRSLVASTIRNIDGQPLDSAACMDQYPEFPAEFRCGTAEPWIKIAIRKKRGTERGVEAPEKPPLKLDFNEDFMGQQPTARGQRWPAAMGELGYRKLSLNNGQSNKPPDGRTLLLPVLLHEHVALRLLRREIPSTPGVAYAKLTLYFEDRPQGEYHGVYILIEDIDRTAVRRRWGNPQGRLLKHSKSNCSPEVEYDDGPPNAAAAAFDAWIRKDPARFPGTWLAESAKGVDLDTLLRQEAIREIIVNGDDTLTTSAHRAGQGSNWFAFDPRQGLRQYMPWDLDLTFGQQYGNCQPTPLKCPPTVPLLRFCGTTRSVVGRLTVCQPEIQKRYLEIMCQLTRGSLSAAEILKVWEQAWAAVGPIVPLEKDLIWGGRDPSDPRIDKSVGAEYVRLKQWIPERIRSVQQQLTMRGVACSPGCPAGARESCQYLGCPGERRCENNLWTPCRPLAACNPAGTPDAGAPDGPPPSADARSADAAPVARDAGAAAADTAVARAPDAAPTSTPPARDAGTGTRTPPSEDPGTDVDDDDRAAASGCQCAATGAATPGAPALLLPLALALAALARRRRDRR